MINLNDKIPLCDPEKKLCSSPTAALIFQVFNATSFFINIAHLIVLCNLQTLKGKPYWSVLVALCYVDIWLSVSSILAANCELWAILNASANLSTLWNLIIGVLIDSGWIVILLVHCLTSTERYMAVCWPFAHKTSIFIRHIGKFTAGLAGFVATTTTCFSVAQLLMDFKFMCIGSVFGPTHARSTTFQIIIGVFVVTTSVVTSVLMALTRRQILRQPMTDRHLSTGAKFAVKYVTAITIMFVSIIITSLIVEFVFIAGRFRPDLQYLEIIAWVAGYMHTLYSVINCLIYAGLSETYRKTLVRVFIPKLCWRKTTAAAPPNLRTQQPAAEHP